MFAQSSPLFSNSLFKSALIWCKRCLQDFLARTILVRPLFLVVLALCVSVGPGTITASTNGHKPKPSRERSSKQSQLEKIRSEIASYKKQLASHAKLEKQSRNNLSAFNRRTAQLELAISNLEDKMSELEEQKAVVEDSLKSAASSLDQLKQAYANSSLYLYTHGSLDSPDPETYFFVPNSDKATEAIRNRYYAHLIGEAHAMSRSRLDSMKRGLGISRSKLSTTLNAEAQQIGAQSDEQATIEARKKAEAKQLLQIQHDNAKLKKLLAQRTASAKRLEGIIENLVIKEAAARKAEERKKAERAKEKARARAHARNSHNRTPAPPEEADEPVGRSYGPHSLSWPSASHRIVQAFGEHRNADLGTITMNLGIDISTGVGSSVVAAADGIVSLVSTLPSYGTIVVLEHSGGLHTVYADLRSATVRAGSHVHAGQLIGRSGSNEETGDVLHFEVWKGKTKQNPAGWLR